MADLMGAAPFLSMNSVPHTEGVLRTRRMICSPFMSKAVRFGHVQDNIFITVSHLPVLHEYSAVLEIWQWRKQSGTVPLCPKGK